MNFGNCNMKILILTSVIEIKFCIPNSNELCHYNLIFAKKKT